MSTATATPSAAKPAATLAASARFKAFATTFSIAGPVVYCVIQYFNWPLFTFWPASDRFVWGYGPATAADGPNMLWYGWSLSTILVAAALGLVAMMLPARITDKIPLSLVWILPILAIPYVIYSLMPWWTLAAAH